MNWHLPTESRVQQKQERSMIVRENRDRGTRLHLGLGQQRHSSIKKHNSDLQCQRGTRSNFSHGRQTENTLVFGLKNWTRRG